MLLNRARIKYWAKIMAITIAAIFAIGPVIGIAVMLLGGSNQ